MTLLAYLRWEFGALDYGFLPSMPEQGVLGAPKNPADKRLKKRLEELDMQIKYRDFAVGGAPK